MIHRRSFLLCASVALGLLAPLAAAACSGSVHIELERAGVYALDYASIIARQPGLQDCASADLVLRQQGNEIPLRVVDRGDGRFGPGSRIEWIGAPLHGPASWFDQYSTVNVYLLDAEPGAHRRFAEASTPAAAASGKAPARLRRQLHLEQENLMIRLNQTLVQPGEEPDVWQWAKLTHVDPAPFSFDFDLADLAAHGAVEADAEVRATLDFRGLSDVPKAEGNKVEDHAVEVSLNGTAVATLGWNGRNEVRKPLTLPARLLKAHGNTLTLRVPQRRASDGSDNPLVDVVMFNFIELDYPIEGSLDASTEPFLLPGDAPAAIELAQPGDRAPAVYTAKGDYLPGHAIGHGRWRFDAAPAGAILYPVTAAQYLTPSAVRAVAASDWRNSTPGYDYLIVAHPRLIAAIEPLAAFHRSRGLKVAVIDVNEVYDQFNGGIIHPRAIRNLVQYATTHWQTQPHFLLLVGDASFDIRHDNPSDSSTAKWATHDYELLIPNHFDGIPATPYRDTPKDLANRNLIPTWQFPSEEGQSASDNPFVNTGNADATDFHPTLAVGRLPVVEPAEVSAIVAKTIAYFTHPQPGRWRRDVLFIANEDDYFKHASDEIAAQLESEGFAARKVYGDAAEKDNLAHQADIKQSLDDGQLLVHFLGHGGRYIWRTGPPDLRKNHDLFTLDDVSALHNGGRLPMVLSMTCYSAPFDNPTEDSIGERFLREADKGAVAVFAASWRNTPDPAYSKALIAELLMPGQTIGDAIIKAKRQMRDRTLVETYNLLGDPALVLDRPKDALTAARPDDRWDGGIDVALPHADFHGEVDVDWLDAEGRTIASNRYHSDAQRFHVPAATTAQTPASALLYALDPQRGRDAIGAVRLAMPEVPVPVPGTRPRDPIRFAREQDRWQSAFKIALPGSSFRGQLQLDWLDLQGKVLASKTYLADSPRLRLPEPPPEIAPQLAQVRVLASDPRQAHDAGGQFYLIDPPVKGVLIRDPPTPATALQRDAISRHGFESGSGTRAAPGKIAADRSDSDPATRKKSG